VVRVVVGDGAGWWSKIKNGSVYGKDVVEKSGVGSVDFGAARERESPVAAKVALAHLHAAVNL
jgi:hypothetical protein